MTPLLPPVKAAFFDVDRTLVAANTASLYVGWRLRRGEMDLGDLAKAAGWIVAYTLGILDAEKLARKGLSDIAGVPEHRFQEDIAVWYEATVSPRITKEGRALVAAYQQADVPVVLLSAGSNYAVQCLADELSIADVLSSTLEVKDGVLTGQCTRLCYGAHKLVIAEAWAKARGIHLDACSFYTDSISDRALLEQIGHPRVINPDPRLRLLAQRRGWSVEKWA